MYCKMFTTIAKASFKASIFSAITRVFLNKLIRIYVVDHLKILNKLAVMTISILLLFTNALIVIKPRKTWFANKKMRIRLL